MKKIVDRYGKPVTNGAKVRVQFCCGRYGQTQRIEGELVKVGDYHVATVKLSKPAEDRSGKFSVYHGIGALFNVLLAGHQHGSSYRCYHEHKDFEHGHESWLEVIEEEE